MTATYSTVPGLTPLETARFHSNVGALTETGCREWMRSKNAFGYGKVKLRRRDFASHRVAWTLAHGPIPDGMCVLHRCDNPSCCNPDHLFLGTVQDNKADCVSKGRHARGTRCGCHTHPESRAFGDKNGSRKHPECLVSGELVNTAKITEDQVREIRRLYSNGMEQIEIANRFPLTQASVSKIVLRKTWKHVA
jgi:hypothetical protein